MIAAIHHRCRQRWPMVARFIENAMRPAIENGTLLGGIALITWGIYDMHQPSAKIFAGCCLIIVSIIISSEKR